MWTYDRQKRQRILCWGSSDGPALIAAGFAEQLAKHLDWSQEACDFELSFVRRLKLKIKDLERDFARIIEREENPIEIARAALNLPEDA
jgi:hypothetical protein